MFMSASLKHLFSETATIRSHDKQHDDRLFLTSGAKILIFFILLKISAIPKHVDLSIKSQLNRCWLLVLCTSLNQDLISNHISLANRVEPDQAALTRTA